MAVNEPDFPEMREEISGIIQANKPEGTEILETLYVVLHWNGDPRSKPRLTLGSCQETSDPARVKMLEKAISMIS